ncbi:dimeric dUTPase (all-alpha-NTP-PPase superfamily) [Cytobacillus eiseniae]|uniref:Dimeric dUTPase (All-alpha-NTP-PPase superfamily) n=1 Tax=Cytobacillus eiseniae TaxID=762947 RepID=A0ABS4RCR0_9BACI|nr:dUTP diphosphatase [Cytobacillus eiseniae]MBP2240681.1 dimeric dUTPase (all-alpha-NTP-PPase superfamily) [Cytobacillus eiseniae]
MNYQKLFAMQKGLDQHIESKHKLEDADLFDRKILALLVELGELANETRCFKFWSLKQPSERKIILEEYVDGIHFILSLGLECGFENEGDYLADLEIAQSVNDQFLLIYEQTSKFRMSKSLRDYKYLLQAYLHLGEQLGFHSEETEQAYLAKNEVNYERQQAGY